MGNDYDYAALGLKVGIEIHQQLKSKTKLFCSCPNKLRTDEPDYTVLRKHRPVLGETGQFDKAMLVEFLKDASVIYEGYYDSTCTYELDETPPFLIDEEATNIALEIALLFRMHVIRELHVCRKNYVDGSVPGGFQRTTELAKDGKLLLKSGKEIGIENIFIEEDAARRIKTEGKFTTFRIDRLGIPLVEITTSPEIYDPEEARDAAYRIGLLMRSTGKVKKALGAIRQDINISIKGGERIEIKGVQKLDWIPILIKFECQRQLALIDLKNKIADLGLKKADIKNNPLDVSSLLKETNCKFVSKGIKQNQKVYALRVPKFAGLFGLEVQPNRRFGTEIASKIKVLTGLKGLIHSDEALIEKYNFSQAEIDEVCKKLKVQDGDAFILLLGKQKELETSFDLIIDRIKVAFDGVPGETRQAKEDGTHEFLREISGGARLYPDTDSESIKLLDERIDGIHEALGPYPWDMIEEYSKKYKLQKDVVEDLIMDGLISTFDKLIEIVPDQATLIITTLTETVKAVRREGNETDNLEDDHFISLFTGLKDGSIAKEAFKAILEVWTKSPELSIDDAKETAGISDFDISKLDSIVEDLIQKNMDLIKTRGRGAMGPLMGDLMNIVGRGAVDGKTLSKSLNSALAKYVSDKPAKKGGKK